MFSLYIPIRLSFFVSAKVYMEDKVNILEAVAFKNEIIATKWNDDGCAVLVRKRIGKEWLRKMMPHFMPSADYLYLDAYGSDVWRMVDGKTYIVDIVKTLKEKYSDEADIEVRVTKFIQQLHRDGLISLKLLKSVNM